MDACCIAVRIHQLAASVLSEQAHWTKTHWKKPNQSPLVTSEKNEGTPR